MAGKAFFLAILFIPLTLSAQVYRCDGAGGLVYSQIPCGDNAEQVVIHDPMLRNEAEETSSIDQGPENEPEVEPPSAMENFIATLHRQQQEQLAEIDQNIVRLKQQLRAEGDEAPDDSGRQHILSELSSLVSARASVSSQYDALIAEASSRTGSPGIVN